MDFVRALPGVKATHRDRLMVMWIDQLARFQVQFDRSIVTAKFMVGFVLGPSYPY